MFELPAESAAGSARRGDHHAGLCLFYLLAQMVGAGGLVALLLNITSDIGQALVIAVVGVLMIVYVLIGGMKGTTWVQIIKAVLLIGGAALMTVWVLAKFGANFSEILGAAQAAVSGSGDEAVAGRDMLAPGAQYGASLTSQINSSRWRWRWSSAPRACRTC